VLSHNMLNTLKFCILALFWGGIYLWN
jgi:hypothetical protein